MRTFITSILMGILCMVPALTAQQAGPETQQVPAELMKIERDKQSGLLLVTAIVADKPMRFLLDTGATHTIIHRASTVGIRNAFWLDTSRVQFTGNSAQRPQMMAAPFQIGPALVPRHVFMVIDLSSVRRMMGEPIDGILGMDILGLMPFTFDFKNEKFMWAYAQHAPVTPVYGQPTAEGRFIVHAQCEGKVLELLLDTGCAVTRVNLDKWPAGSAGQIAATLGDINSTTCNMMHEGKPADLTVAEGVTLPNIQPMLDDPAQHSALLGVDALKESVLIHKPTRTSPLGQFFFLKQEAAEQN